MVDAEVEEMGKKLLPLAATGFPSIPNSPKVFSNSVGFIPPHLMAELVLVEEKRLAAVVTANQ